MGKVSKKASWEIVKKIFFPLCLFILFLGGYIVYKVKFSFYVPAQLQENLRKYLLTLLIIIIGFIIQRFG